MFSASVCWLPLHEESVASESVAMREMAMMCRKYLIGLNVDLTMLDLKVQRYVFCVK